jgi:RecA/RadA recombinase
LPNSPSSDRLPTVAASQVLDDLKDDDSGYISTGIAALDKLLFADTQELFEARSEKSGGVRRGVVTEIWGPPGSGRSALG